MPQAAMLPPVLILVAATSLASGCRLMNRHSSSLGGPASIPPVASGSGDAAEAATPPTGEDPGFALVGPPLQAVGPAHPMHGFPMWYADATGTRVDLCINADTKCVAPPADFDPTQPVEFPENFPGESFYWLAEARIPLTTGGEFRVLFALEAAFAAEVPAPGQRVTFARTLFVASGVRDAVYRVTHPYGLNDVTVVGGRVRDVSDVGLAKERFDGLLTGPFGTLLRWDQDAPAGYLGDAAVPHSFTGSPLGTNFFRIDTLQAGVLTSVGSAQVASIAGRLVEPVVVPSLMPNTFPAPPALTLAPTEPGATVYYTLDGSDPTTSSTRFPLAADVVAGPITIKPVQASGSLIVSTVSEANGVYGKVSRYAYTIDPNTVAGMASPTPGVYSQAVAVSLAPEGSANEIRYTTDGTDPMNSVTALVFSGTPVTFANNDTHMIRYRALRRGPTGAIEAQSKERKAYYTVATEKLTRSPINPAIELPFWIKDTAGMSLTPCVDPNDPMCLPTPVGGPDGIDATAPIVYPRNYAGESFLWYAGARTTGTAGNAVDVTLAIEGAFAGAGPAWGERVLFARLRIRADLTIAGHYRLTHPYGVKYFQVESGATGKNAINHTDDIDPIAGNFDACRFAHVGPFLQWSNGAPTGYIGDPNVPHTVVGSPFGTNFIRLERLQGTRYETVMYTDLFNISGKLAPDLDVDASPMGAFYTAPQQLTLTASEASAQIWYTIDGTVPVIGTHGTLYTGPVAITQSTTVKFVAALPRGVSTAVKTASYTIDTTAPAITVQPPGGNYADRVTVALSASRAGRIYYTLDATSPLDSLSRSLYTTPLTLTGPTPRTLKSVAIDQTGMASDMRTDSYSFAMTVPVVSSPATILAANVAVSGGNIPTVTSWSAQTFGGRTISSYRLERSINGGAFTQVALTTPTTTNQRLLLTAGRSYEYRVGATDSGGLNAAATRGGPFNLTALQEAAGAITYRRTWLRTVATNFFGGTARSTTTRNASATIRFTGSQVAWITAVGPTMGIATVTLDGVPQGNVDLYSRTNTGAVLKFVRTGLPRAVHTLVITATGTRNVASTGNRIDVDAVAVIN
ncbi:MAG: hypothetical protein FJ146_08820 [Deltaproteobacteria bacterium]|nr:hypothetical protein [Deltaproteobacteria bacterium]